MRLPEKNFSLSDLTGASLDGADIRDAYFSNTECSEMSTNNIKYNSGTKLRAALNLSFPERYLDRKGKS